MQRFSGFFCFRGQIWVFNCLCHLFVTCCSSRVANVWKQLFQMGDLVKVNSFASQQRVTKFVNIQLHVLTVSVWAQGSLQPPPARKSLTDDSKLPGGVNVSIN